MIHSHYIILLPYKKSYFIFSLFGPKNKLIFRF